MRVTEKNLEHTKEVLYRIYCTLNQYYESDTVNQIEKAQKAVKDLQTDYTELEYDLTGFDDYITEQQKLLEQNKVVIE